MWSQTMETESDETQSLDKNDEVSTVHHNREITFVKFEKTTGIEEHKKNRTLWIPLKPVEDIEDY
jgi:hypothetical protein